LVSLCPKGKWEMPKGQMGNAQRANGAISEAYQY